MAEIYSVEHLADVRLQNSANPLDQLMWAFLNRFVLEQDFASLDDITDALAAWSDYSTQNGAPPEVENKLTVAVIGNEPPVISAGVVDGNEIVIAAIKLLANP